MRYRFFELLYDAMLNDPNIWVVTGDLGYGGFDRIKNMFPERFLNVGAAEQTMVGVASGLAFEGKKVFCYSITPFLLYRPFEFLRTYVNHEVIPIVLVGSGRDEDYGEDGFSHTASDVNYILGGLTNIIKHYPTDNKALELVFQQVLAVNKPFFISLERGGNHGRK